MKTSADDAETLARIDFLVDGYRHALLQAHGLAGRMECDGPSAAENLSAVASAAPGSNPAGVSASSPDELPPAGVDPSRTSLTTVGCRGGVCGEGVAADSGILQPPAATHQTSSVAVESGLDMCGRYAAEFFPQHSRFQK